MIFDFRHSTALVLLVAFLVPEAGAWQISVNTPIGPVGNDQILVPTNQVLNPAGKRVMIPLQRVNDVAVSPNGDLVAVLTQGNVRFYGKQGAFVAQVALAQNASMKGIAFSPDGKSVAVSGTGDCGIDLIDVAKAAHSTCLRVPSGSIPTGLSFDLSGTAIFVALNKINSVAKIDLSTGKVVATAAAGVAPLGVALTPDGLQLFITNQGGGVSNSPLSSAPTSSSSGTATLIDGDGVASGGSVSIIDIASFQSVAEIPVGKHPGGIAISPDGTQAVVANANSDSVSIIDSGTLTVTATLPVPAFPAGAAGSSPTDVAFSKDGLRLYVTLAGANAVAAFDASGGNYRLCGTAGTDWFPIAVATSKDASGDDVLFVASSKGIGPRAGGAPYNVRNFIGTMNVISGKDIGPVSDAAVATANNPFPASLFGPDVPADLHALGIEHVFLIVKENRTYDQVLGDVAAGNGSPDLAIYGGRVTPNLHNLASNFVLLDNYYASGTVSADGHQWITQAMATDYAERQSAAGWPRSYPYSGEDPLVFAPTGFIWGNAIRHGLTARIFGEFSLQSGDYPGTWTDFLRAAVGGTPKIPTPSVSSIASMSALHSSSYPAFNLGVTDTYRARLVLDHLGQWEEAGKAPNLVIIQLPCDHTVGTTPGAPTPQAMVADNDLAVGRIVEALSHSSFWATSAVFVTEDDSQDGVDHVDGHRTTCFLASPFARRGQVDSTNYNHTSLIRTIEDLLGLPPMNRFDASATPMRASFVSTPTSTPDATPFDAVMSNIPLDQTNPALTALKGAARRAAKDSLAMNFKVPDAAPEKKLNRILWQQAKGWNAKYPKPPHAKTCPKDAD